MLLFHLLDSWSCISRQITEAMQGGLDEASLECLLSFYEQSSSSGGELTGYMHRSAVRVFSENWKAEIFPSKRKVVHANTNHFTAL